MAKVERLAQLSNLIKRREAISVKEMSRACGVSQRTIYRYLKTLSKLGSVEQGYDSGVFTGRHDDPMAGLDASDLALIDYCLGHNPLTKYPFFLERLSRVRQAVRQQRDLSGSTFLTLDEQDFDGAPESKQNDLLERFMRAKQDGRKVSVTTRQGDGQPRTLTPVAIRISRAGVALIVEENPGSEIKLSEITRLTLSSEPAERAKGKTPGSKTS